MKTYAVNNSSGHTFYVMAADGSAPDREKVNKACLDIGGKLVHPGAGVRLSDFVHDAVSRDRHTACCLMLPKCCIIVLRGHLP